MTNQIPMMVTPTPPKICEMVFWATGDRGIHTNRPKFYVACTACRVVVHENTTGLSIRINEHLREQSAEAGYARAMTAEDDERIADARKRGCTF